MIAFNPVQGLLIEYLHAECTHRWPGTDGLTQQDIVDQYPESCRLRKVPNREELCRRHFALRVEIAAFFTTKGWDARD